MPDKQPNIVLITTDQHPSIHAAPSSQRTPSFAEAWVGRRDERRHGIKVVP